MFDHLDYDTINYFIRVFGRIGFVALILVLYRLYRIFASPLTQKKHKNFIVLFGSSIVVSLLLLVVNYALPTDWFSTLVMTFNTVSTYMFAGYLYYQGNILERYTDSDEYRNLSRAMDAMILKLKS